MNYIILGPDEHRVNDQACDALISDPLIYVRGGQLVRVLANETDSGGAGGARIVPIPAPTLRERLTLCATWVKVVGEGEEQEQRVVSPTKQCVEAVMARGEWPGMRRLVAIADGPTILADGTILETPGYDSIETGLFYAPRQPVEISVPHRPIQDHARRGAECLLDLVGQFPFAADHHRSAWLAALLTPLARHAFAGPAPMFALDANTRGSGKSMLVNAISMIVRGEVLAFNSLPNDGDELRKQITTILLGGSPLVNFDDIGSTLGGRELNALLTSEWWADRILGANKEARLPNFTTWFATGNNIGIQGDTQRRVCPIRLESPHERPEDRDDFKVPNLLAHAREHRGKLLSAGLTILRAYIVAGRPKVPMAPWGSFEGWSGLVRGSIVWAGMPDPALGREVIRQTGDDRLLAMAEFLARWPEIDLGGRGLTGAKIVAAIDDMGDGHDLSEVLAALVGPRPGNGREDKRPRNLGNTLREFSNRVFAGRAVKQAGRGQGGVIKWQVVDGQGESGDSGDSFSPQTSKRKHPLVCDKGESGSPESPDSPTARRASILQIEARLNEWNQAAT